MNEERLKDILENSIDLIVEHEAVDFGSPEEFWEYFYGQLGTSKEELKSLGIDTSVYL